jgi:hypothetical protein
MLLYILWSPELNCLGSRLSFADARLLAAHSIFIHSRVHICKRGLLLTYFCIAREIWPVSGRSVAPANAGRTALAGFALSFMGEVHASTSGAWIRHRAVESALAVRESWLCHPDTVVLNGTS